jgi:hypothetical protein
MTRRFIVDKEDGSKEIIDGHCENCGSSVRGFYDLFSYGHHKSRFVASVTRNLNMKIKVPNKMAWKML